MGKSRKAFKNRSCSTKTRYKDRQIAKSMARSVAKKRGYKVRIYFCEFCKGYHLTKQRM